MGFSDEQVALIVFNETRSLSGPGVLRARANIAHVIFNMVENGELRPMASRARPPAVEMLIFHECVRAVEKARAERSAGQDPTEGATHFNFRKNAWRGKFLRAHVLHTQVGPLDNSYPTVELPGQGIYANTYQ